MLFMNAIGGFVNMFDFTLLWPSELGHPREVATEINLSGLGYTATNEEDVVTFAELPVPAGVEAQTTTYTRVGGSPAYVTVFNFPNEEDASTFFAKWQESAFRPGLGVARRWPRSPAR